jgi:hypothetical protein
MQQIAHEIAHAIARVISPERGIAPPSLNSDPSILTHFELWSEDDKVEIFAHRSAAVALLPVVNDPVAARTKVCNLVGLVEEAEGVAVAHRLLELVGRAAAELVRLDALVADDGGAHDAAVPILTAATTAGQA